MRLNKHEFIKFAKHVIFQNFPGIFLENEKYYGKSPNQFITLKAKPDSVGRTCPLSVRQHSKNSIYFVLNPGSKTIICKCFKCTGFRELTDKGNLLNTIKPEIVISEKTTKKTKTTKFHQLENLDEIKIVKFEHNILFVDENLIMEFYDLNLFVCVAARLDKKAPVFSNWNSRTFEDNEKINFKYNNIAIVCGRESNIFVVDIDINDSGLIYFQQLCSKHNYRYDNATTAVLTPSGGIHLYYQYNELFQSNSVRLRSVDDKPIGIDIRSNSGCVIAPPSVYPKGNYNFICMKRPQVCPDFILELCC